MKNYYNILNVDEGADEGAIKKAYRKLQMKYHPDKGGDPEKAKEINEAYDCLGDTMKRKQYDMQRNGGPFGMPGGLHGGMPGGMPAGASELPVGFPLNRTKNEEGRN